MKMNELKPIVTLIAVVFFAIVAYIYNGKARPTESIAPTATLATQAKPDSAVVNKSIKAANRTPLAGSADAKGPVKTLPFIIERIMLNDLLEDKHKLVKIEAGVRGGNRMEWAATAVAIAEVASRTGVDSIEVVLNRFEVPIEKSAMYRELSHIYYAPNPSYSIWGDALKDKWEIYVAHKKNIATQKDMDVNDYFEQANQQLIDSGVEYNEADDKAGVMTAKKFQLKKDFMLFSGNVNESDDGVSRASINIINEGKDTSLTALNGCLSAANINVKACTKQ